MVDKITVISCNGAHTVAADGNHDFVWYLMGRGLSLRYIVEILWYFQAKEDGIRKRRDAKIRKAKRHYETFKKLKIKAPASFKNVKYLTECNYKVFAPRAEEALANV